VFELKRSAVREAASRFRVTNPRVFGSVLHGTDRDGSDLDLLVDALPGATLFDLGGLQDELESLLGVHVDLLTPADLPPKFRARVLAEARPVMSQNRLPDYLDHMQQAATDACCFVEGLAKSLGVSVPTLYRWIPASAHA